MLTTASSAVLHATRSSAVLAGLVPALGVGLRAQLGDGLGHHEAHALADYLSAEALCDQAAEAPQAPAAKPPPLARAKVSDTLSHLQTSSWAPSSPQQLAGTSGASPRAAGSGRHEPRAR